MKRKIDGFILHLSNKKVHYAHNASVVYKKLHISSKHCKVLRLVIEALIKILIIQCAPLILHCVICYFW